MKIDPRHILQPAQNIESASSARAATTIGAVRDVLQFDDREARHEQRTVDQFRLHDVRDASVDHNARVKNERFHSLHVPLKFDVRNYKSEIVARLPNETDPAVTENQKKRRHDALTKLVRLRGRVAHLFREERLQRQAEQVRRQKADQKPEVDRRDPFHLLFRKRHVDGDDPHR